MSDTDLVDLTPVIDLIFFGTTDPEEDALGGIMVACDLTEDQVVEDDDPGERPEGLFVTYKLLDGGEALYGQAIEDYIAVEEDPELEPGEGGCLLRYDNARTNLLRISVHAPAATHTDLAVRALARKAQRHLASTANRDLLLLGLDAYVVTPGHIRNATTVLNEQVERVFSFDAVLLVGETFKVAVNTFDTFTLSTQEGTDGEEEKKEFTP